MSLKFLNNAIMLDDVSFDLNGTSTFDGARTMQSAHGLPSNEGADVSGRSDQPSPSVPLGGDVAETALDTCPRSSQLPDLASTNNCNVLDRSCDDFDEDDSDFSDIEDLLSAAGQRIQRARKDVEHDGDGLGQIGGGRNHEDNTSVSANPLLSAIDLIYCEALADEAFWPCSKTGANQDPTASSSLRACNSPH